MGPWQSVPGEQINVGGVMDEHKQVNFQSWLVAVLPVLCFRHACIVKSRSKRKTLTQCIMSRVVRGLSACRNTSHRASSILRECDRGVKERLVAARCASSVSADEVQGLPSGPEATVRQASMAVALGRSKGVKRQILELPWPLSGASELDDWPGGIMQEYNTAKPIVEQLLRSVGKDMELKTPFTFKILDDSDAVVAWQQDSLLAVLFATGDTVREIEKMASGKDTVVLINPQWRGGQVISDFGLFFRKQKEEFVATFTPVYSVTPKRVSERNIWVRSTLEGSQAFAEKDGEASLVAQFPGIPEYSEVESAVKGWLADAV
eukprot:jgi/Ulvmu1/7285/UM035_0073.1